MTQINARRTIYKGIPMRSRLEARVAAHFDLLGLAWEYEPCAFASDRGQYLPDFRITTRSGARWYVETKGPAIAGPELIQQQMEIIWASEPDARLFLVDTSEQWWLGWDGKWSRSGFGEAA